MKILTKRVPYSISEQKRRDFMYAMGNTAFGEKKTTDYRYGEMKHGCFNDSDHRLKSKSNLNLK